jgi:hypothetical protein
MPSWSGARRRSAGAERPDCMAIEQAADFIVESESLHELLRPLSDPDFARPTQFKGWSINAVPGVERRDIADTRLETGGEIAARWMSIAQCFAGPPMDPPASGTRRVQR